MSYHKYEMRIADLEDSLDELDTQCAIYKGASMDLVKDLGIEAQAKQHYIELLEVAEKVITARDLEITLLKMQVAEMAQNVQAYKAAL